MYLDKEKAVKAFMGTGEKNAAGEDLVTFLEKYDPHKYQNPCNTVDMAVFAYNESDRAMFFFHAIRVLTESEKDRSTDLLKNIVIKSFAMGYVPEVPDFALDKHTTRGMEMGRDSFHFLHEASKVIPQMEVTNTYKEEYEALLKEYDPNNTVPTAFVFNSWQI